MAITKAEAAKMRRLEIENAELRAKLAQHFEIYRDQSWELVTLRTALSLVRDAIQPLELEEDE